MRQSDNKVKRKIRKAMREDEYHEVEEARLRLEEEAVWLEGKAYHCRVHDQLMDAEQWEAMAYIKREKLNEL